MEKTEKEIKERKKLSHVRPKVEEPEIALEYKEQHKTDQIVYGWMDAMEVAKEVWKAGNLKLLEGDLIFAYKNTGTTSNLHQIVLVRYFTVLPCGKVPTGEYGLSVVTPGYSYMLPRVGKDYLSYLYDDMASYKLDKNILTAFRNIIDNEITCN